MGSDWAFGMQFSSLDFIFDEDTLKYFKSVFPSGQADVQWFAYGHYA